MTSSAHLVIHAGPSGKACSKCEHVFPIDGFQLVKWVDKAGEARSFRRSQCKMCEATRTKAWRSQNPEKAKRGDRKKKLRDRYEITPEDYDRMLVEQDGCCAACGVVVVDPDVDHDHSTGEVRGLLCGPCNRALGALNDNVEALKALIVYLSRTPKLRRAS